MYNNYGFNPYYQQPKFQTQDTIPQQPMLTSFQQPMQKVGGLLGKSVDNIDVVKAMDIPLDGSVSYFPLTDGSAIVSKQLQNDGTSKIIVYKPSKEDNNQTIQFATLEDIQDAISELDLSDIQDLKDDIKEIKKQIKEFKVRKGKED